MKGAKNMEINKQLFEDVLSSKSKGTFVLRNGNIISSDRLRRAQQHKAITAQSYSYILEGKYCTKDKYYTENGWFISDYIYHPLDIVDFIPEINMETKELTIEIPEGFEIDKVNSSFEKIVFKKKNTKPRSWDEYVRQTAHNNTVVYWITELSNVKTGKLAGVAVSSENRNVLPSKELAEAFLAMMQLMSLRHEWIHLWSDEQNLTEDWKPDWTNVHIMKYCIIVASGQISMYYKIWEQSPLSFPTGEMAEDFKNCFIDLLEIAKPLI